jgi:hypothetical protein
MTEDKLREKSEHMAQFILDEQPKGWSERIVSFLQNGLAKYLYIELLSAKQEGKREGKIEGLEEANRMIYEQHNFWERAHTERLIRDRVRAIRESREHK